MSEIEVTHNAATPETLYGLIAEFEDPDVLVEAAEKVRAEGYRKIEAYTPFPVHGLSEALGYDDWRVPWLIFCCGCLGLLAGYMLEYSTANPVIEHLPRFLRLLPTMNEM